MGRFLFCLFVFFFLFVVFFFVLSKRRRMWLDTTKWQRGGIDFRARRPCRVRWHADRFSLLLLLLLLLLLFFSFPFVFFIFLFIFGFPDEIFLPSFRTVSRASYRREPLSIPSWLASFETNRPSSWFRTQKKGHFTVFFFCLLTEFCRPTSKRCGLSTPSSPWLGSFFKMSGRKEGVFFFTFLLLLYELRKSFFFYP